jgi:hypothetical protein
MMSSRCVNWMPKKNANKKTELYKKAGKGGELMGLEGREEEEKWRARMGPRRYIKGDKINILMKHCTRREKERKE